MANTTAPALFTHNVECIERTFGKATLSLISIDHQTISAAEIMDSFDHYRKTETCDCGKLALTRVENDLRLARKALRSHAANCATPAAEHRAAERIAELVARRDALRAELAR